MSGRGRQAVYLGLLLALIAGVALARWDLFVQAFETTLRQARKGPAVQAKLFGEIVLFACFLLLTLRVIPARVRPRRDAAIFAAGLVFGWLVEAWGTRLGLWRYYTRETPPLWVLPAWSLGALIFDRVADRARAAFSPRLPPAAPAAGYWTVAAAFAAAYLWMARPAWGHWSTWALLAALCAALGLRAEPRRDFWVLAVGLVYVFFADFWGTSNNCWRYHVQTRGSLARLLSGVGFGMLFDSVVALAALRAARALAPGEEGPIFE